MHRVSLPFTYGYENFIDDRERDALADWILCQYNEQKLTLNRYRRYFGIVDGKNIIPCELFNEIKLKIMHIEKIDSKDFDPFYKDFISINLSSGAIDQHKDQNLVNKIHTRYNLLLRLPTSGGKPVYNGVELPVKEKMIWKCEAGKYMHGSTPVQGIIPRLNISFGFQIYNAI